MIFVLILIILFCLILTYNNNYRSEPFISPYSQCLHNKISVLQDRWDKLHSQQFYYNNNVPFDDKNY